jgi:hypothetical protein
MKHQYESKQGSRGTTAEEKAGAENTAGAKWREDETQN